MSQFLLHHPKAQHVYIYCVCVCACVFDLSPYNTPSAVVSNTTTLWVQACQYEQMQPKETWRCIKRLLILRQHGLMGKLTCCWLFCLFNLRFKFIFSFKWNTSVPSFLKQAQIEFVLRGFLFKLLWIVSFENKDLWSVVLLVTLFPNSL